MKAATSQIALVAPMAELAFFDQQSVQLPVPLTPLGSWRRIMAAPLPLLGLAFRLRDALSAPFGVRRIGGFDRDVPRFVQPGDRLSFFTVEALNDTRMTLAARDRHLDVMVCLTQHESHLTVTTSVKVHTLFGRIYMLPVRPAHRLIVAAMLRRLRRDALAGPR